MTNMTAVDRYKTLRLLGALAGLSVALGACTYTTTEAVTASVPDDYRLRHPIAVQEADRSIVVFVGHARGGLSAPQRADVLGLAQTWVREGTGTIVADVPLDTPNAHAAASAYAEIRSLLAAGGGPPPPLTRRNYPPPHPLTPATITQSYPPNSAGAAPRGQLPRPLPPPRPDQRPFPQP